MVSYRCLLHMRTFRRGRRHRSLLRYELIHPVLHGNGNAVIAGDAGAAVASHAENCCLRSSMTGDPGIFHARCIARDAA